MIISYKGLTILYIYTLLINTLWFTVTRLERYFKWNKVNLVSFLKVERRNEMSVTLSLSYPNQTNVLYFSFLFYNMSWYAIISQKHANMIHLVLELPTGCLDVLWCQPIKLIYVVSTSEFHEYWWNNIDFNFFVPSI